MIKFADPPAEARMLSEWTNDKENGHANLKGPSLSMILATRLMLALPLPAHLPLLGRQQSLTDSFFA